MDPETKRYLDKMDKRWNDKLNSLLEAVQVKNEKSTWLTANQLTTRTGITCRKLTQLRKMGQVEYKESRGGGWLYKLESLPEILIKQKI